MTSEKETSQEARDYKTMSLKDLISREQWLIADIKAHSDDITSLQRKLSDEETDLKESRCMAAFFARRTEEAKLEVIRQHVKISSIGAEVTKRELEKASLTDELKEVQATIVNRSNGSITIYADGYNPTHGLTIHKEDDTIVDDSGWNELCIGLFMDERFNFHRIEYELLAKALAIALNGETLVKIVSEIDGFEAAFDKLILELRLSN